MALIGVAGVFASLTIIAVVCIALRRLFKKQEPDRTMSRETKATSPPEERQVRTVTEADTFKIRIDGEEHSVQVREMGTEKDPGELVLPTGLGERFRMAVDGEEHTVKIEGKPFGSTMVAKKKTVLESAESASGVKHLVKAPMRGTVVRVHVKADDKIEKGKVLLVLETMKMENAIESPVSGIVKNVRVSEGEAVDADTVLIMIS
jgi:biotin carboxyl carrier protein